ncbi:MAG TPA: hypothetical protein VE398_11725 [Acidobacteriota bacterium]|nr:hypothetical protein [Acidobacteriota bacterium]
MRVALIFSLLLLGSVDAIPSQRKSSGLEVLVNGGPVPKYHYRGTTYIEALKGQEYAIRITNPSGTRVAVALSVDGLNTIDARHTEARLGHKWVLEPYDSVVISGWQTGAQHARRFFFTTEDRSYGAWLGETENLGVISAAFFREKIPRVQRPDPQRPLVPQPGNSQSPRRELDRAGDAGTSDRQSKLGEATAAPTSEAEYAATGIGDRIRHAVQWIRMDLEEQPFSVIDLRYEFRPALVRLGVFLPQVTDGPLTRRERARGFHEPTYCPEP